MLALACMIFGFTVTSCDSDDNEPPKEPDVVDFSIEFGRYLVGGSESNYNGHISGTESTVVKPELVGINTVVVNLGPKLKKGPNTTRIGKFNVFLTPILDSKTTDAGWEMENLKFEYNGKTTSGPFDLPWGSDEDGRTIQVTMSFDLVSSTGAKPSSYTFDLSVIVIRS